MFVKRLRCFLCSLPSARQVKTDFSTTQLFHRLRQTQSMSGSEPDEKVTHLYMKRQYTSTIKHQASVFAAINPLQLSMTGMWYIFMCEIYFFTHNNCTNSTSTHTITTTTRTTTITSQEELLWQLCDWSGNDYFPALVSDAIKGETFQRYNVPHNTHMKMISSTVGSRVLRDCTPPLFLPQQTPVIATTFF